MAPIRSLRAVAFVGTLLAQPSMANYEKNDPILMKHVRAVSEVVDKNKDGKMSREEFLKYAKEYAANHDVEHEGILEDLDANGDKRLSLGEIQTEEEHPTKEDKDREEAHELKKFKLADSDRSGYLEGVEIVAFFHPPASREVLQAEAYNTLKRMDGEDKNSQISLEEFIADADQTFMKNAKLRAEREMTFKLLDRDSSNSLSLRELMDYEAGHHEDMKTIQELFDAADANKDGHLDNDEIHTAGTEVAKTNGHNMLMTWAEDSGKIEL